MLSAAVIEMICSLVKGAGWPSGHLEEVRTEEAGEEGREGRGGEGIGETKSTESFNPKRNERRMIAGCA